MEINEFIERQLAAWPAARERFGALKNVEVKRVGEYNVQFNPARAVSTTAKVDATSIAARPCFLCGANRPEEQMAIPWEDLEILVNPYPIFPGHLTIPAREHQPQMLRGRVEQMRRLSRELPGYTVFFNGARCGASAPDHFHFQAVPGEYMNISPLYYSYTLPDGRFNPEEVDEMVNVVCTDGVVTVIPRVKHRPECYGELLVSPACIDLCGTLIAVRREDFERLDAERIEAIIREVTMQQPPVYVGIVADRPTFRHEADGSTSVEGVTIGKDFHWERRRTHRFGGLILEHEGQLINRIGVEDYLCSVISSEMSATSSSELLKAHAVISRSWLLAQLRATRSRACMGEPVSETAMEPGEIRRWFDRDDHDSFDVCSDDHCQRYQGLTQITSPHVAEAVAVTRGLVLTDTDGRIADARFSKCCGGAMELFRSCWRPRAHSYLRGLADSAEPARLPDLTQEDNARAWILGCPAAFCSDVSPEVLQQVLNDYDTESTPDFYRWTVRYSAGEIAALLRERSGIDFGEILALEPLERGASGRIVRLSIVGAKTTRIVGKELMIRRWLSPTHLLSSAFVAERRDDGGFTLHGAGWGHGVGLCQIGAANMAAQGHDFRRILLHYYPETKLTRLY